MEVRRLSSAGLEGHLAGIASVHAAAYDSDHFTSRFTAEKLRCFNRLLIEHADFAACALSDDDVSGFVIAGPNVSAGVDAFVRMNRMYLLALLLRDPGELLTKLGVVLRRGASAWRPRQRAAGHSIASYRLLSIAVAPTAQGKGVGQRLLAALEEHLVSSRVSAYGLSVRNTNVTAIRFYERSGFVCEREGRSTSYYRKDVGLDG